MKDVGAQVFEVLKEQQPIVMATIIDKSGPAPREVGANMLIKRDFSIEGTIGGGILEAMTMKLSASVFNTREFVIQEFDLSNKDTRTIVKVLLEYIDPYDSNKIKIFEKARELRRNGTDYVMITKLSKKNVYLSGRDKWICTETGFYGIEDNEVQKIAKTIREDFNNIKFKLVQEKERYLVEPFFNFHKVCIIGAGHIGQKVAEFTKTLGFYTVVVDDREDFANVKRFQTADEVKVIPSFHNLSNHLVMNHNCYIVIVTRGNSYDMQVLAQMLKTDARYIGMIGSRTKRDESYTELLQEGFTVKDMERVYCPIGVDIYAQTPEEIAVSIAAELIKVRRGPANEKK
jgi:xanthine dehydrogenase accessory factor